MHTPLSRLLPLVRLFWSCLFCLFPTAAFAANPLNLFTVDVNDACLVYLSDIFGTVGDVLTSTGGGNQLMGSLFLLLNTGIFAVGISFLVYTAFAGTLKTAHEGHAMGKESSLFLTPVKAGIGLLLMLPTQSGYSHIQVFVMWVVINSVGAANQLWTTLYQFELVNNTSQATATSLTGTPAANTVQNININTAQTVQNLLSLSACMYQYNNVSPASMTLVSPQINVPTYSLSVGTPNNPTLCGTLQLNASDLNLGSSSKPSSPALMQQIANVYLNTYAQAITLGGPLGFEAYANGTAKLNGYTQKTYTPTATDSRFFGTYNDLLSTVQYSIAQGISSALTQIQNSPATDGGLTANDYAQVKSQLSLGNATPSSWVYAGAYYYNITHAIASANNLRTILPNIQSTTMQFAPGINNYVKFKNTITQSNAKAAAISPTLMSSSSSNIAGIDLFSGVLQNAFIAFATSFTEYDPDPIISLSIVGNTILQIIETMFWATIFGILLTMALSACYCLNPFPAALMTFINSWTDIFLVIIAVCWTGAAFLAFYVPLIPYMVFLFATISWFILVVEAMVAAPLVAVAFMLPSEDEFGKGAVAMGFLASLFFRPPLMIIGFGASTQLAKVMLGYVNQGFAASIGGLVGDLGFFGWIGLFTLYVTFLTSILNECYSLIYVLPDKLMRWMGGQAEQSTVAQALQKVSQAQEKGAEQGKKIARGASTTAGALAQDAKGKKKE
ncbi:MAG: DotA/TraY family protein [Pseudomonadota bacterium]